MKMVPIIAADMSGTLGGIVASHNRFGSYFRLHVIPTDPNTGRQQTVRTFFSTAVIAWGVLTSAQRTGWNVWAANTPFTDVIGNPIFLTGQNAYIRQAVPRLQAGLGLITDAPTVFNNGSPVTGTHLTVDLDPNVLGLNLVGLAFSTTVEVAGNASDDGDVLFFLGPSIPLTRNFYKGPYQLALVTAIGTGLSSIDISDLLTALLSDNGDPIAGQNRPIRMRIIYDDGRLSDDFKIIAPVVTESV